MHFLRSVRRSGGGEAWYGFSFRANEPLGTGEDGGVTVLAGFDARRSPSEAQDFLFLRGL